MKHALATRPGRAATLAGALIWTALDLSPALAHQKWFASADEQALRFDLFFRPLPLALVGAVLLAVLLAGLLWRARGERGLIPSPRDLGAPPERLAALYGLIPAILGVHLAVPLLVRGVQGQLFSPDNPVPGGWALLFGLAQTGVALALFYGGLTRLAALALTAMWALGVLIVGPEPMLENTLMLGFAAFFWLAGRGPISIDRLVFPRLEPTALAMRRAVPLLRISLGVSLVVVALTEKLARIPFALSFLREHPLNFTPALGVPLSDEVFVLLAGSVELFVGLMLVFGFFTREVIVVAWLPFNLTLTVFNWGELIGHLPVYGILALLLVWTPGKENLALWVKGLREGPLPVLEERGMDRREAAGATGQR